MTIGNLTVSLSNSPGAGQREFTLLVNGLAAGPICFFFGSNTTCSDPSTVSVQKFDRLAIRSEGTGGVSASVVAYSLTATAP
jgi:hypothetical protein